MLNDEAKNAWVRTVEAGLGTDLDKTPSKMLYDSKLMAMLFGRWQQNLSMYKCNNVGHDLIDEVRNLSSLMREKFLPKSVINNISAGLPNLNKE